MIDPSIIGQIIQSSDEANDGPIGLIVIVGILFVLWLLFSSSGSKTSDSENLRRDKLTESIGLEELEEKLSVIVQNSVYDIEETNDFHRIVSDDKIEIVFPNDNKTQVRIKLDPPDSAQYFIRKPNGHMEHKITIDSNDSRDDAKSMIEGILNSLPKS